MNKIEAILYDLGDIFFEAHFWRKWMYEQFQEMKLYQGSFRDFYNLYDDYLSQIYTKKKSYDEVYLNFLNIMKVGNPDEFKVKSFKVKEDFEVNRILYPGVESTLKKLNEAGIKNIVISDNELSEKSLREKVISKFNINQYLYGVVTSLDVGHCKPSKEIFEYTLNKFGLSKQNVLFVAHDKDEIDGATNLGISTVELNNYLQIKTKAKYRIENFSELLHLAGTE